MTTANGPREPVHPTLCLIFETSGPDRFAIRANRIQQQCCNAGVAEVHLVKHEMRVLTIKNADQFVILVEEDSGSRAEQMLGCTLADYFRPPAPPSGIS